MSKLSSQVVGNVGLYFTCYQMSLHGWNVMPTARNAKGGDIMAYSEDGSRVVTIQVKTLSTAGPRGAGINLGKTLDNLFADYVVVCLNAVAQPECFVLTRNEVENVVVRNKTGKQGYWLSWPKYAQPEFRDNWDRIEGRTRSP